MAMASVLTFHDSVELFLHLALETLANKSKTDMPFMAYFEDIDRKLTDATLSGKMSMDRLNSSRNNLKHKGVLPDHSELEGFRGSVTTFFRENTPVVFDTAFDSLSLVQLVEHPQARIELENAESLLTSNDVVSALQHTALAFDELIWVYRQQELPDRPLSPMLISTTDYGSNTMPSSQVVSTVKAVNWLMHEHNEVRTALDMLELGIDSAGLRRFQRLAPRVNRNVNGEVRYGRSGATTEEECRWCIQFVLESAIRLQT